MLPDFTTYIHAINSFNGNERSTTRTQPRHD